MIIACSKLAGELKKLARSQHVDQNIVLLDVGTQLGVIAFVDFSAIDRDSTLLSSPRHQKCALTDHVQERGLSGAARAHDGHHLVWADITARLMHDLLKLLLAPI